MYNHTVFYRILINLRMLITLWLTEKGIKQMNNLEIDSLLKDSRSFGT